MGKKDLLTVVVLAMVAGFAGGVVSSWIFASRLVFAQQTSEQTKKIISAQGFYLVDEDGRIRATFGFIGANPELEIYEKAVPASGGGLRLGASFLDLRDQDGNSAQLHVSGEQAVLGLTKDGKGSVGLFVGNHVEPRMSLLDKDGKARTEMKLSDGEPSLELSDKDEKTRAGLKLYEGAPSLLLTDKSEKIRTWLHIDADEEPSLVMYDKDTRKRATLLPNGLGFIDQDKTRAMLTLAQGKPGLILFDKNEKTRAELSLALDGEPSLELSDQVGKTHATLGHAELKDQRTGSIEKRSASSLVLFGEDGKVIWEAP